MREIETDKYGPVSKALVAKALAERRPQTLNFSAPVPDSLADLKAMTDQTVSTNRRVRMPHDAEALRAGLWLLFDYMEESHALSQNIATPSGSYWHGILHRREGDASNAKYWFVRAGEHPIFPELLSDALEISTVAGAAGAGLLKDLKAMNAWDAAWFVERCTGSNAPPTIQILLEIQRREWLLLFDSNFRKAFA